MIPKAAQWKKDRVANLQDILSKPGVVGIVGIAGVPATNMLDMRANLRDGMTATMAKKTLIRRAWSEAGLLTMIWRSSSKVLFSPCLCIPISTMRSNSLMS